MSRASIFKALVVLGALAGVHDARPVQAQEWSDYLHWPYVPPQSPANASAYQPLYDKFYVYPREQRIVPQVQGPYYRNYYGGQRILGHRHPHGYFHDWNKKKFYQGAHFTLDVF